MKSSEIDEKTYVFAEVASLIALPALDALGRTRLRALLSVVALLLAVSASVRIDPLLGAVSGTMTFLRAVDTLDGRCHRNVLRLLLLTMLKCVSDYLQGGL